MLKKYKPMSDELFASEEFKTHARKVIKAVDTAISMLGPDLEPLANILKDLGRLHVKYGIIPAHYDVVGQALIETLGDVMGDKFTNDLKASWAGVYDIISSTMIEGAKSASG